MGRRLACPGPAAGESAAGDHGSALQPRHRAAPGPTR